jgi:hypothetical protein
LLLTVVMTLALPDVHAISIGEAEGVKILQTSHVVGAMTIENTSSGSLELNLNRLRSVIGSSPGYINMTTNRGWVVRNLPVLAEEGYPYSKISAPFDLGS